MRVAVSPAAFSDLLVRAQKFWEQTQAQVYRKDITPRPSTVRLGLLHREPRPPMWGGVVDLGTYLQIS